MRAVDFTFDHAVNFVGVTDGTTWNGFTNVRVTPATLDSIMAHFREAEPDYWRQMPGDVVERDYWPAVGPDGLVDLSGGFATGEVAVECTCAHLRSFHLDGARECSATWGDLDGEYRLGVGGMSDDEPCLCRAFVLDDHDHLASVEWIDGPADLGGRLPICGTCRLVLERAGDALVVPS